MWSGIGGYCIQLLLAHISEVLLFKGKGFVFTYWGGLCRGRGGVAIMSHLTLVSKMAAVFVIFKHITFILRCTAL